MAKITRKTASIFGSTASANQIAQFGSLAASSPQTFSGATADPAVIQSLSEWQAGWFSAATNDTNSPAIEDMNAVHFVNSYQLAYLLQQGVPEWDSGTTYYLNSIVSSGGIIYVSLQNTNLNNAVSNGSWWQAYTNYAVQTSGAILFPNGTQSHPAISWANETNSGFYRDSGSSFTAVIGGSSIWQTTSNGFVATLPIFIANGAANAPSLAFENTSSTTGFYLAGTNSIGFAINGATAGNISSSKNWTMAGSVTSNSVVIGGSANNIAGLASITCAVDRVVVTGNSSQNSIIAALSNTNFASIMYARMASASSTGQAYFVAQQDSGTKWSMGMDLSVASGSWILANNDGFITTSSNYLQMTTGGAFTIGATGSTQTHTVVGKLSASLLGITSGSAVAAGIIGELIGPVYSGGGGSPAYVNATGTGQFFDVASLTLTAGEWNVFIQGNGHLNGATLTEMAYGIGTSAGNTSSNLVNGSTFGDMTTPITTTDVMVNLSWFFRGSGSQTIYFKGFASYSAGTPQIRGVIWARRVG